jgi:outer membrane protein assembly factor BamB
MFALVVSTAMGGQWPQFRGFGDGMTDEKQLPVQWSSTKAVVWKVKVPGYGWSSPVVWDDRVFLTTAVSENQLPPERKGPGGGNPTPVDAVYRWEIRCLDRMTGKTLWKQTAAERKPATGNHVSNTYASETPVTDGCHVYAYFGMCGLLCCYDVAGNFLWKQAIGPFRMFSSWGTASSPVQDESRIFVQCDNEEESFLTAFDKRTGRPLWRVARQEGSAWSTPLLWKNRKRTELVLCGGREIRSYNPATGAVIWELGVRSGLGGGSEGGPLSQSGGGPGRPPHPPNWNGSAHTSRAGGSSGPGRAGRGMTGSCKASPVASDDLLFVGFGSRTHQQLGPLWAVKAGASGDISLGPSQRSSSNIAWFRDDAGPVMASPLIHQDQLYIVPRDGDELTCLDAKTGRELYKQPLPDAVGFFASPWAYDGRVFFLDTEGRTYVIKAGPRFNLLGVNDVQERCRATPALSQGAVLLRTMESLYCFSFGTARPSSTSRKTFPSSKRSLNRAHLGD